MMATMRGALAFSLALEVIAGCGDNLAGPPDAAPPSGSLSLVGHTDLMARGMNSAMAIVGNHAYIGSRTDGVTHANAGILVVDISDPSAPAVVGAIGEPVADLRGVSTRELRGIPSKNQLVVLSFPCADIHGCLGPAAEVGNIRVFDLSTPTAPTLLGTFFFGNLFRSLPGHEFFLWQDPGDPNRVLLHLSTPIGPPAYQVLDISDPANMTIAYAWDPIDDGGLAEVRTSDTLLHSVAVTRDGTMGLFSSEGAGFYLVDTSDIAAGVTPGEISLLTPSDNRVDYSPPAFAGLHSATMIPGRDLAVITDEIYPAPIFEGCPWGWARIVSVADPTAPQVVSEFRHEKNDPAVCAGGRGPEFVTYTAHNTTNTESLSLITWHSAGLQVLDTTDPTNPTRLAEFLPEPVDGIATEDPTLGGEPILMWSYPIIKDGLIYVIDIRNGLYVLRYSGTYENEIARRAFLEGNSNL